MNNDDRERGQPRNTGAGSRQMEQQAGGGSYRPGERRQQNQRSDMSRQPGDDVSFESDREDIGFQQEQNPGRQPENRQREQDRGGRSRDNNRSGSDSNR